jgi:hypothetical protein
MKLSDALYSLPEQMRLSFELDVMWWRDCYNLGRPSYPEEWAVEKAFSNMRRPEVMYRKPEGATAHYGHWCLGHPYCLQCHRKRPIA